MKKLFLFVFILCFSNSVFAMFDKKMNKLFENAVDKMGIDKIKKRGIKQLIEDLPEYKNISNLKTSRASIVKEQMFDELISDNLNTILNKILIVDEKNPLDSQIKALELKRTFLTALEDEFRKNNIISGKQIIMDNIDKIRTSISEKQKQLEKDTNERAQILKQTELLELEERKFRADSDLPSESYIRSRSITMATTKYAPAMPEPEAIHVGSVKIEKSPISNILEHGRL